MPTLLEQRLNKHIPGVQLKKSQSFSGVNTQQRLSSKCLVLCPASSQVSVPTQGDQQLFPWTRSHCLEARQER